MEVTDKIILRDICFDINFL